MFRQARSWRGWVAARIHPTPDGGARLQVMQAGGRILIDGVPVVIAQRLSNGARVCVDPREFVFRDDEDAAPRTSAIHLTGNDPLSRPNPRAGPRPDEP